MEQRRKTVRFSAGTLRWGMLGLVMTALLVFGGAALAQETQPQTETPSAQVVKPEAGMVVIYVATGSPAAAAGVVRGDIIMAVGDDPVNTQAELTHVIASLDPGAVVTLKVMHGDEERSLSVTLGDNSGRPVLGVLAVGDQMSLRHMDQRGTNNFDMPGRKGRQGGSSAMPFGRGQMPDMPFGHGQGMIQMGAESAEGALVMGVENESAAAAAGLQAGDVITAVNEMAVVDSAELVVLLGDHKPGDVVTLTYIRDTETISTEVTLGAHPDDEAKAYLGVQLAPAGPVQFRMDTNRMMPDVPGMGMLSGLMVGAVTKDGPAATAGLKAGDWITAVNGEAISDPQVLVDFVQAAAPGDTLVLTVQSKDGNEATDVTVTLGENDEGGALLGVQIGAAMRIRQGPGGTDMNFDSQQFRGQDGNRFEFRMPQFRFQAPGNNDAPVPDVRFQQQPSYQMEGA